MSNNKYFINNFTFQQEFCNNPFNNSFVTDPSSNFSIPPPPLPPGIPGYHHFHHHQPRVSDEEILKQFERRISKDSNQKPKRKLPSISEIKKHLQSLILTLNEAKTKQKYLTENLESLKEDEWNKNYDDFCKNKLFIEEQMKNINDTYLNDMNKALAKRGAKRLRLKRLKSERQIQKQELMKKWREKSRSIDERLQRIQDDIDKVKQEEQSKLQADAILKEVLRKKHDAKKYITKLEALVKLRKARLNTAKGRGLVVPESGTAKFNEDMAKLSLLWTKKLAAYEREEKELREKLKKDTNDKDELSDEKEREVACNLRNWREYLFGNAEALPQFNFKGDLKRFVEVRSDWDQYASEDGMALPIGWVTPNF